MQIQNSTMISVGVSDPVCECMQTVTFAYIFGNDTFSTVIMFYFIMFILLMLQYNFGGKSCQPKFLALFSLFCRLKLINSHEFIYSHREVSNHNSLPWLPATDP